MTNPKTQNHNLHQKIQMNKKSKPSTKTTAYTKKAKRMQRKPTTISSTTAQALNYNHNQKPKIKHSKPKLKNP